MSESISKSWLCVLCNPEENGITGTPQEIVNKIIELWIADHPQGACAATYCIAEDGLKHCHAVLEDDKSMRFSSVKKTYPEMHIEPTKGTKEEAKQYIAKEGKFAEKVEKVVYSNQHGEIQGCQGHRSDLEKIDGLIQEGKTPREIKASSFTFRKYSNIINDAYYDKRYGETPLLRDVKVYWHVGKSGTGKTYTLKSLADEYGESSIYFVNTYEYGFDKYGGEPILILDELRDQLKYADLLSILDGYKVQIPCRYSNVYSLWNEVHITSVWPPEAVYHSLVGFNEADSFEQLKRRITTVVYHYKADDGFCTYEKPMNDYTNYKDLQDEAEDPFWRADSHDISDDDLPF